MALWITEAFPWDTAPEYLIRNNNGAYGEVFTRRARSMGIRDRPNTPRQNGYVERVIGSIRHDCLDCLIARNEGASRLAERVSRAPTLRTPWPYRCVRGARGLHHQYSRT
jgi:hypothetical protein